MVRQINTGGGKSHKKKKNTINVNSRELLFCEDGQDYAIVEKLLGNRRCIVKLYSSGEEKLGHIRGNMKGAHNRVKCDDIVLVSLRDFQESKVDVIHVYNQDETKHLVRYEEIDSAFVSRTFVHQSEENIIFDDI